MFICYMFIAWVQLLRASLYPISQESFPTVVILAYCVLKYDFIAFHWNIMTIWWNSNVYSLLNLAVIKGSS